MSFDFFAISKIAGSGFCMWRQGGTTVYYSRWVMWMCTVGDVLGNIHMDIQNTRLMITRNPNPTKAPL